MSPTPTCLAESHSLLATQQMLGQREARFGTGRSSAHGWHDSGGEILRFSQGAMWPVTQPVLGTVDVWEQFGEGPVGGLWPAGCLMLVL